MGAAVLTSEGQVGYDMTWMRRVESMKQHSSTRLPALAQTPPTSFFLLTVFEFRHVYSVLKEIKI